MDNGARCFGHCYIVDTTELARFVTSFEVIHPIVTITMKLILVLQTQFIYPKVRKSATWTRFGF
jgi:hypothetical protein